jgi:hypothetical protein
VTVKVSSWTGFSSASAGGVFAGVAGTAWENPMTGRAATAAQINDVLRYDFMCRFGVGEIRFGVLRPG